MKSIFKTSQPWTRLAIMMGVMLAASVFATSVRAASASEPSRLRVIYLQGYLSCSHNNQQPVATFLDAAAQHADAVMYYGCFDGGYETHPLEPIQHFYLYKVSSDGQWSAPVPMSAQTAPLEIAALLRQDMSGSSDAHDTGNDQAKTDVLIAGHSHGGWMAIRVAYQLGLMPQVNLRELLTIDPISYDLCASQWFPAYVAAWSIGLGGVPDDCHRAPKDIAHLAPAVAKTLNHRWTNIYQEDMAFVSSGPIVAASRNIRYVPKSMVDTITAHRAVFIDNASWQMFYRRLRDVASGVSD